MRVYLAAAYSRREELCGYREDLRRHGITVCATWLEGPNQRLVNGELLDAATEADIETRRFDTVRSRDYAAMCARQDLADVRTAHTVVMFTGGGRGGGRHLEVGYALAFDVPVVLVGPRENVFHCLPGVRVAADWPTALAWLTGEGRAEAAS